MRQVAVTGGDGFLGKYVVRELAANGLAPVVVDQRSGADLMQCDLDSLLVSCSHVIHLAGRLGTAELFEEAESAIDVNVKGTLRVLESCRRLGVGYVGITMPVVWNNVYAACSEAKLRLAAAWHDAFGVPVSIVRAFNAYGFGQHVGRPQKIVPTFASRAWNGRPIPIWGDGSQLVDLVHAKDVSRVLVAALEYEGGEQFNAGTGHAQSVQDVAEAVLKITGSEAGIEYLPMRPGETGREGTVASGVGWEKLGWRPAFDPSEFEEVVRWYRTQ